MKKINFKKTFSFIFITCFALFFFVFPEAILSGVKNGIGVCGNVVIPSLFPFLIISSFFVKSDLCETDNKITGFIAEKIFRLPTASLCVILMSFIGGFPVGIRMITELFDDKKITEKEAERLSLFCVNAGPAFVINAVGITMLGNKKAGVIIFISLTLSSLLIGFFSRFFYKNDVSKTIKKASEKSFSQALVESVSDSISAMLSISSWIIFIAAFLPLLDKLESQTASDFLKAFFEVTSGTMIFSEKYHAYFLSAIIGFSGLCVHCQLLPNLNKMKVRLPLFFLGRMLSAVMSSFFSVLLFKIFPSAVQTFSNVSDVTSGGLSVSIPTACSLFFMCGLLILDLSLDRRKKIC